MGRRRPLGRTAYEESKSALARIGYGAYTVEIADNKLIVASSAPGGMDAAADSLCALLAKNTENKNLALPEDTKDISVVDPLLDNLPVYEGGSFSFCQEAGTFTNETAYQITVGKTSADDYRNYLEKLQSGGFTSVQNNAIGNNTYDTFAKEDCLITVYHMPGLSSTRIIIERNREIVQPYREYTAVKETTVMQLGLDADNPDLAGAMNAYAIQLADGNFVLMDTGVGTAAKYIYQYLRENTPSGQKIKIAAVFISHPHPDHMDGFIELAKYSWDIECEAVYLNFGAFPVQNAYTLLTLNLRRDKVIDAGKALGAKAYITRTGQKIQIANALFEVLWNPEDIGNQIISDYNNASMVVRMTVGGKKVIFLGDCGPKESPTVVSMYREALACDIITVAHHGYTGAPIGLYIWASPETVLWPNIVYPDSDVNSQLLVLPSVKKHYLAGEGQAVITLEN